MCAVVAILVPDHGAIVLARQSLAIVENWVKE